MLNKRHYIILVLVVLLVVVLLKLPSQTIGRFKLAISGLFLPLFGLSGSAHALTQEARVTLISKRQLANENETLRLQNEELQIHLQQDEQLWTENARLRALVAWPRQVRWHVKLGRVIARDPENWWRTLQIDLGSRDGLKPNFAVMNSDGLVGRVQSVGATRSQVILLGDPALRVAALVPTNGETGVILSSASSPQENDMVDLDYLSGNSGVRPGQNVETWGVAGGVFPPGIPIGKVVDSRVTEFGLATEARVKLAADLGSLQEVWVIMP
jgi:rod shape-determining protein MreC